MSTPYEVPDELLELAVDIWRGDWPKPEVSLGVQQLLRVVLAGVLREHERKIRAEIDELLAGPMAMSNEEMADYAEPHKLCDYDHWDCDAIVLAYARRVVRGGQ